MTATALAVRPPVHAAAPPAQNMAAHDMGLTDQMPDRLPASLLSVPVIQRKCAACEAEDRDVADVLPRLEVGPVDDPYEREADAVAGRVMAMRELPMARRRPALARRKCATCEAEERKTAKVLPRLEVGPVDDPYEREADAVAGRVMAMRELPMARRRPALVRRKCATCEAEERKTANVLPRLEVGPVDDTYEHEADAVAGKVMAMRTGMAAGPSAPRSVQGACAACSHGDDVIKRRALPDAQASDDEEEIPRMRVDRGAGQGERIAASATRLTTGGSPLSDETRSFFESRMGRDLSGVRVHEGPGSRTLNESISARAFTYQNHIWLTRGETADPGFTMAHELTHVLQQTQPGALADNPVASADGGGPQMVRRALGSRVSDTVFFVPAGKGQEPHWAHDEALQNITYRNKSVLGELRVPNANANGQTFRRSGVGAFGFADVVLTKEKKVWGLAFVNATTGTPPWDWFVAGSTTPISPVSLDYWAKRNMYRNGRAIGGRYADRTVYGRESVPHWGAKDFDRVWPSKAEAYEIGDIKFVAHKDRASEAESQSNNYVKGFNFAKNNYDRIVQQSNEVARGSNTVNRKGSSRHGKLSSAGFSAALMSTTVLGTNDFIPLKKNLKLKPQKYQFGLGLGFEDVGSDTYPGKAYYRQHPSKPFLWEYVYWPDRAAEQDNASSRKLRRSGLTDASKALYEQITKMPTGKEVKRLPLAHQALSKPRVQPTKKHKPAPPVEDPFSRNFAQWKRDQSGFTAKFEGYSDRRRGTGRQQVDKLVFDTALENTMRELGGNVPAGTAPILNTTELHAAQREFKIAELMSGQSGRILGQLRKTFGTTFVKALNIYHRLRAKFQDFLDRGRKKSRGGSAKAKAILKVAGVIFGTIIKVLLPQVGAYLVECVEQGFKSVFSGFLEKDFSELTDAAGDEFIKRYEEIAGGIEQVIEQTAELIKTRYGQIHRIRDAVLGNRQGDHRTRQSCGQRRPHRRLRGRWTGDGRHFLRGRRRRLHTGPVRRFADRPPSGLVAAVLSRAGPDRRVHPRPPDHSQPAARDRRGGAQERQGGTSGRSRGAHLRQAGRSAGPAGQVGNPVRRHRQSRQRAWRQRPVSRALRRPHEHAQPQADRQGNPRSRPLGERAVAAGDEEVPGAGVAAARRYAGRVGPAARAAAGRHAGRPAADDAACASASARHDDRQTTAAVGRGEEA